MIISVLSVVVFMYVITRFVVRLLDLMFVFFKQKTAYEI